MIERQEDHFKFDYCPVSALFTPPGWWRAKGKDANFKLIRYFSEIFYGGCKQIWLCISSDHPSTSPLAVYIRLLVVDPRQHVTYARLRLTRAERTD